MAVISGPAQLAREARVILDSESFNDKRHPEHRESCGRFHMIEKQLADAGFSGIFDPGLTAVSPKIWTSKE